MFYDRELCQVGDTFVKFENVRYFNVFWETLRLLTFSPKISELFISSHNKILAITLVINQLLHKNIKHGINKQISYVISWCLSRSAGAERSPVTLCTIAHYLFALVLTRTTRIGLFRTLLRNVQICILCSFFMHYFKNKKNISYYVYYIFEIFSWKFSEFIILLKVKIRDRKVKLL